MLYRTTAARSALRALSHTNASVARSTLVGNVFKAPLTSAARSVRPSPSMALAARKPVTTALVRYASTSKVRIKTEIAFLVFVFPRSIRANCVGGAGRRTG